MKHYNALLERNIAEYKQAYSPTRTRTPILRILLVMLILVLAQLACVITPDNVRDSVNNVYDKSPAVQCHENNIWGQTEGLCK